VAGRAHGGAGDVVARRDVDGHGLAGQQRGVLPVGGRQGRVVAVEIGIDAAERLDVIPANIDLSAAEAVAATTEIVFESYDDAVAVRDDLAERIDAAAFDMADVGDDAGYEALTTLRLALVRDVTQRGGSLDRLYSYTPPSSEPALVTAQRLYGDADRAQEIVDRNRVRHPGFVPAGAVLEVLTDG